MVKSIKHFIVRWLIPKPLDLLLVAIALMVIAAILIPISSRPFLGQVGKSHWTDFTVLMAAAIAALFLYAGLTFRNRFSAWPVVAMFVLLGIFVVPAFALSHSWNSIDVYSIVYGFHFPNMASTPSESGYELTEKIVRLISLYAFIGFAFGFLIPQVIRLVWLYGHQHLNRWTSRFTSSRTRILVTGAVGLFVIGQLVQATLSVEGLISRSFDPKRIYTSNPVTLIGLVLILYYGVGVLLCWRLHVGFKVVLALLVAALCWSTLYYLRYTFRFTWFPYGFLYTVFLLILLGLGWCSSQQDRMERATLGPSAWSVIPVLIILASLIAAEWVHLPLSGNSLVSYQEAIETRSWQREYRGAIFVDSRECVLIDLSSKTSDDILTRLASLGSRLIVIRGLNPRFKVGGWPNSWNTLSVIDSDISVEQLQQFCQADRLNLERVKIVGDLDDLAIDGKSQCLINIGFLHDDPNIEKLLEQLCEFPADNSISFEFHPVGREKRILDAEWILLQKLSDRFPVTVSYDLLSWLSKDRISDPNNSNIQISERAFYSLTEKEAHSLFLNSYFRAPLYFRQVDKQQVYEFWYSKYRSLSPLIYYSMVPWELDQTEELTDRFFVYGRDEAEKISHLYGFGGLFNRLPDSNLDLVELSFKQDWLTGTWARKMPFVPPVTVDGAPLLGQNKLERLYFERYQIFYDFSFLRNLPNLRELAINMSDIDDEQALVLQDLSNLQWFMHYGDPDPSTVASLGRLENLQKFSIVNCPGMSLSQKKQIEIRAALPNVQIEFRDERDLFPPSTEFDAHAKKLQAEIRAKYLKEVPQPENPDES